MKIPDDVQKTITDAGLSTQCNGYSVDPDDHNTVRAIFMTVPVKGNKQKIESLTKNRWEKLSSFRSYGKLYAYMAYRPDRKISTEECNYGAK